MSPKTKKKPNEIQPKVGDKVPVHPSCKLHLRPLRPQHERVQNCFRCYGRERPETFASPEWHYGAGVADWRASDRLE